MLYCIHVCTKIYTVIIEAAFHALHLLNNYRPLSALLLTEDTAAGALDEKETIDSATRHRDKDDGVTSFVHRPVAVEDRWKRRLHHQRIRNWRLCPDSIDKVE